MKATNSLLLLYEQTLKAELESRKNSYNNDLEVYEERISSCRITLKSHKECYFQNPLAQELLALQAEKEEIERRIQAFDDHEQQPTVLGLDDAPLDEMQGSSAEDEEHAPNEDDPQGAAEFPQTSSQGAIPQANPLLEKTTAVPSTPTFSPSSSPHGGTSDAKSPAFLFSLNSDPSTPGFSGFGFDVGASIDEDSSFAFAGSFFNDKKTTRAKPSSCPEFLFDQPGQSEDFQFAFTAKSPQSANKENTRDEFPFSFNF
ncbi:uncharacterized protein PAE49_012847 [Odontesthes bonariensis]